MATILLAAAGAAVGSSIGGTVLGLSGAVIGRAVGATVGRVIDQRLLGAGSDPVEVGRIDRFRIMGASEGAPIPICWGSMRLAAQVIWASPYRETATSSGGGKGAPTPRTTSFSYSVSLALALCEGPILGIGRIWADGEEIARESIDLRLYPGDEEQLADPAIEADVGAGMAPTYRGTAYVVLENLALERFGNRVPQFSFEVFRAAKNDSGAESANYQSMIRAVALIPGTGEYSLETRRARVPTGFAATEALNVSNAFGETDFARSIDQLERELPNCRAVSLVICWFGDDLSCGRCSIRPKVEDRDHDAIGLPWRSGGIGRNAAEELPQIHGRPIYGGTPSDASIIESVRELRRKGKEVLFYPFVLMEQIPGNTLDNPYSDDVGQPAFPWRGRITLSIAPGRSGSPEGTGLAVDEVRDFFGTVEGTDFFAEGESLIYAGPAEDWGYRRFILHYAHLCKIAGGVEAFCVGSELRGLTQIMGPGRTFPAVMELVRLTRDVRAILGPDVKISYAADWSEYFGYQRGDDVYFHLDPLWSYEEVDFIGIDNYMPLSDWRHVADHADSSWGSIYNLDYLKFGVAGGEGFDWYYASNEARDAQVRSAISDTALGEDWVFRPKDLRSWWSNSHHERHDGLRQASPTDWIPGSKPFRFTEFGCSAVDLGTNAPNLFVDPRSSESSLPPFSRGIADPYLQMQYYRAVTEYWADPEKNPLAVAYEGRMVDLGHSYAWAWDARPYPDFPQDTARWADGRNHHLGHWLNGRASAQPLDMVLREICSASGVPEVSTGALHGLVKGYAVQDALTARAQIQPLSTAFAFDAVEAEGILRFQTRPTAGCFETDRDMAVLSEQGDSELTTSRLSDADIPSHVRLSYILADGSHEIKVEVAKLREGASVSVFQAEYALALSQSEARGIVEDWIVSSRASRDVIEIGLPLSRAEVVPGSNLMFEGVEYRVDRVEIAEARKIEAVRFERHNAGAAVSSEEAASAVPRIFPSPLTPVWLDLPHVTGLEGTNVARIAVTAKPWVGRAGLWSSVDDTGQVLIKSIDRAASVGITQTSLISASLATYDRGPALRVELVSGELSSVSPLAHFNGANLAAIGDGSPDGWELFSFRDAELVAERTFDLTMRLRGLGGSSGAAGRDWPSGSMFVLLNTAVEQFEIPPAVLGLPRTYRVGRLDLGFADPDTTRSDVIFTGVSARPLPVVHPKARSAADGGVVLSWIRQTRIGGDSWEGRDVPLSEEQEMYQVSIRTLEGIGVRSIETSMPYFEYDTGARAYDGTGSGFIAEVSQISPSFGAGPTRTLVVGP